MSVLDSLRHLFSDKQTPNSERLLICGLGNPGAEYDGTRHNIGFTVLDHLAQTHGCLDFSNKKWNSRYTELPLPDGRRLLLLKPQTFMNRSGAAIQAACSFYKLPLSRVLVVVDDINLELGHLRLRGKGSHGGHNGLRDIETRLGRDYPRLRLGVGAPSGDHVGHVLGRFSEDERATVAEQIEKAAACCLTWLDQGLDAAMRLNGPLQPPPPRPKPNPPSNNP